jgi:hypothetical protein
MILKKISPKIYPLDPGSGKNSSRIQGGKKHRIRNADTKYQEQYCQGVIETGSFLKVAIFLHRMLGKFFDHVAVAVNDFLK